MGEWRGEKSAAGKKERCDDRSGAREGRVKSEKGKASNTTQQTCLTGQNPLLYEKMQTLDIIQYVSIFVEAYSDCLTIRF